MLCTLMHRRACSTHVVVQLARLMAIWPYDWVAEVAATYHISCTSRDTPEHFLSSVESSSNPQWLSTLAWPCHQQRTCWGAMSA